jgi:hypothetical protein
MAEVLEIPPAGSKMDPMREHLFQSLGPLGLFPLRVSSKSVGRCTGAMLWDDGFCSLLEDQMVQRGKKIAPKQSRHAKEARSPLGFSLNSRVVVANILLTLNVAPDSASLSCRSAREINLCEHQSYLTYRVDVRYRRLTEQHSSLTIEHTVKETSEKSGETPSS